MKTVTLTLAAAFLAASGAVYAQSVTATSTTTASTPGSSTSSVTGASINQVSHDRAFSGPDVSATRVVCTVETRDRKQVAALHRALRRAGFHT